MAALFVMLPLIVVVEISLQLHQASFCVGSVPPRLTEDRGSEEGTAQFSSSEYASTNTELLSNRRNITPYKVACCICITDQSLQPGVSTLLVIFPPRSLSVTTTLVVRALQLGSRSEICPNDKFVVQLSTICSNSTAGDEALQAAASALFQCENRESDVTDPNGKPKLLWSLFYVQATINPWKGQQTRDPVVCQMGHWTTKQ